MKKRKAKILHPISQQVMMDDRAEMIINRTLGLPFKEHYFIFSDKKILKIIRKEN